MIMYSGGIAAAERTADIRISDRELSAAHIPIKEVGVWPVTDLSSHKAADLPIDEIVSIRAPKIGGACNLQFGTVDLRGGESVEISADLHDLFEISGRQIRVEVVDPIDGNRVEEAFPCDEWDRMDFHGIAATDTST